jgi:putative spermidine/putrescine transport system substrate-binding protein
MTKKFNRRTMIKTAGAAAAFTGFGLAAPNVIRANDKIVRYLGTATTMGSEIDKRLFDDTGIKVQYIPVTTDEVTKRVLT